MQIKYKLSGCAVLVGAVVLVGLGAAGYAIWNSYGRGDGEAALRSGRSGRLDLPLAIGCPDDG
jgi:hypothetical protein